MRRKNRKRLPISLFELVTRSRAMRLAGNIMKSPLPGLAIAVDIKNRRGLPKTLVELVTRSRAMRLAGNIKKRPLPGLAIAMERKK